MAAIWLASPPQPAKIAVPPEKTTAANLFRIVHSRFLLPAISWAAPPSSTPLSVEAAEGIPVRRTQKRLPPPEGTAERLESLRT
jgi:hypothetical protein